MNDIYDIDQIIRYAERNLITAISPSDRKEWKMFCCALKVLGYNENTFVILSSGKAEDSHKAWREERDPKRYKDEDGAKGMIVNLAKAAGIDVEKFRKGKSIVQRQYGTVLHSLPHSTKKKPEPKPEQPTLPPIYITEKQLAIIHDHYKETSLYKFLCSLYSEQSVDEAFELYKVGGSQFMNIEAKQTENGTEYISHGRAVAYPYINMNNQCVDCQIMHVSPTTGSRHDAPPIYKWIDRKTGEECKTPETWALAVMKQKTRRAQWCSFGEHLLPLYPDNDVCIVESAKSAMILYIAYKKKYPNRTWIAIRNKQSLTLENIKRYKGRNITVFPDRDGITEWRAKAQQFAAEGYKINIDTTVENTQGEPHDDLADIVIRDRWKKLAQAIAALQASATPHQPQEMQPTSQLGAEQADSSSPHQAQDPRMLDALTTWQRIKAAHPTINLDLLEERLKLDIAI